MRVLLVNSYHYHRGGDTTHTFALAELLRHRGHEVGFFAMQHPANLPNPDSDLFVSFVDFRDALRRRSVSDGMQVLSRAVYSAEARRKFGQMVDRFKPDVIHFQNIHGHITPSVVLEAGKRELPTVWTLHDYKLLCPNSHFLVDRTGQICEACADGAFYNAILRRCKKGSFLASAVAMSEAYVHRAMRVTDQVGALIVPSKFMQQKLLLHGFPSEKVYHLPLFLPDDRFGRSSKNDGYILFLGRLEPIKGIGPLAEALRYTPDVRLVLAGSVEGRMAAALPKLLPRNATYVGMKRGDELRQLLHGAAAVVLPSVCYENQPLSILEAFAAGKPVIASAIGGMTELVKHGERGLLVPPGDSAALAEAMARLARDRKESRSMGVRAFKYVTKHHSASAYYEGLISIYDAARNASSSQPVLAGRHSTNESKEPIVEHGH